MLIGKVNGCMNHNFIERSASGGECAGYCGSYAGSLSGLARAQLVGNIDHSVLTGNIFWSEELHSVAMDHNVLGGSRCVRDCTILGSHCVRWDHTVLDGITLRYVG